MKLLLSRALLVFSFQFPFRLRENLEPEVSVLHFYQSILSHLILETRLGFGSATFQPGEAQHKVFSPPPSGKMAEMTNDQALK